MVEKSEVKMIKNKNQNKSKNRLKELRIAKGFSQKKFYEEIILEKLGLDITLRTYQNWENPENEIKSKPALLLAEYFNVNVEYLLGESVYKNQIEQILSIQGKDLGNGITAISQEDLNKIPYKDSFIKFSQAHDLALSNDDIDKVVDLIKSLNDTNTKILNNLVTDRNIKKLEEFKDGDFSNLFTYSPNWSNKYNSLKNTDN